VGRRVWKRFIGGTAATLVAALTLSPGADAGQTVDTVPKPGTYSGAGAMVDEPGYGMEVGFIFDGATVDVRILGFGIPGCSGYTSVPAAPIGPNRFETSASDANRSRTLKGRWVAPGKVRGKMVMTVPMGSNCGTPGTYTFKYAARRYGGA
jgi:hypothetical protein